MYDENNYRGNYRDNRRTGRKATAVLVACCVIFSSALGFAGGMLANSLTGTARNTAAAAAGAGTDTSVNYIATALTGDESASSDSDLSVSQIAAITANSVVEITTESVTTGRYMGQYISEGAGSGVIISGDGYVVTNNHVIAGASKITVRLKNGEIYTGKLVGTDEKTDVAVVKIEASNLQPAVFGDSDELAVGDLAIAIGNPLGELGGTVTDGIISALDREIEIGNETMDLLQTNAAINPGNSGGGLFNGQGELIGIVNAKSSGNDIEGIGFAIPVNRVKTVISDLMKYGYVQGRIDTGLTLVDISDGWTAMMYRLQSTGLYIQSVAKGSNAESAGFQPGDRIVSVNGTSVSTASEFKKMVDGFTVNQTVKIVVSRSGKTLTLNLTLAQKT